MITLTDVKTINRLGDTEDDFINYNIPLVISSLCNHCKNHFLDKNIYVKSSSVTFSKTDNSITITDFDNEFIEGDYIRIYGTKRNNGHAKIDSIVGTKLTVSEITLVDETVLGSIIIFRAEFDRSLVIPASKIIQILMENKEENLKREKVDDYEVEFVEGLGYMPKDLMKAFKNFKLFYLEEININEY
ncbi:MAG: hypothetical protein EH224_15155 [Calditrichaeota bacterium]|nr:MAG: hypothetical protein EH224_15155 [Calditrichota bacterium]